MKLKEKKLIAGMNESELRKKIHEARDAILRWGRESGVKNARERKAYKVKLARMLTALRMKGKLV